MEKLGPSLFKCSCGRLFFSEESYVDHVEDYECANYKKERWSELMMEKFFRRMSTRQILEIDKWLSKRVRSEFLVLRDIRSRTTRILMTAEDFFHSKNPVKYDKRYFSIN